jgi:two-component system phosphate regulon sensor histidine kinase PhoR
MDEGVIASLPLGLVIFLALILLASGAGAGWFAGRMHQSKVEVNRNSSALLEAIPLAALIASRDANIQAQNSLAAQLREEIKWDADLPPPLTAAIGRVVRSGLVETMDLITAQMPPRRMQVSVAPLDNFDANSNALIIFTNTGDGSHRAELYQQLVGAIAHELRTPLTAIMGHVEILNSCKIDEETLWRRSLGFVSGETERLARLVEDLLSLSRLDRIPPHIQPINLRVAAEEAVSELFDFAEKNNASLIIQAPADLPRVLADPDRIRQVFLNLLDNAIKYASNNPVTVRLIPSADTVTVEVNNRGPVISPEDLPHLFEPFWRGKESGAKGTGLGLAIVRAVLEQHRATISVNSSAEQGTNFHFSLPIARHPETK